MTPASTAAALSSPHTPSDSAGGVWHTTSPICWQLPALPAAPQNRSSSAERQEGTGDPPRRKGTESPDRAWGHPEECHYGDSSGAAPLRTHESRSSSRVSAGLSGTKPGPGKGTYSRYGGFLPISCRRVSDIGPEEDHRLLKDGRAGGTEEKAAVSLSGLSQGDARPDGGEQIIKRTNPHLGDLPTSGLWPGHIDSSLQGETGCNPPFPTVTLRSLPQAPSPPAKARQAAPGGTWATSPQNARGSSRTNRW